MSVKGEVGIKETKELVIGSFELTLLIIRRLRDGFDFSDPIAIMMDIQKDPLYTEAIKGIKKVPTEARDYKLEEILELMGISVSYAQKIMMAIIGK